MVSTKDEIDLVSYPQEHSILFLINALLGFLIIAFSLLVLIYAPGKTIAKYGTVLDNADMTLGLAGENSNLLILLDDGQLVEVHKPNRFNLPKNKTVILQETTTMFLGIKRYNFYKNEKTSSL